MILLATTLSDLEGHIRCIKPLDAGLKCAARGSLEVHDAKMTQKSPSRHHRTTLLGFVGSVGIFATKAYIESTIKKTC